MYKLSCKNCKYVCITGKFVVVHFTREEIRVGLSSGELGSVYKKKFETNLLVN